MMALQYIMDATILSRVPGNALAKTIRFIRGINALITVSYTRSLTSIENVTNWRAGGICDTLSMIIFVVS